MTNEEIENEIRDIAYKMKNLEQILSKQLEGEYYSSKITHGEYLRKIQAMEAILKI